MGLANLAKILRKNSSDAEITLWNRLKAKQIEGIKFRRQQPVENFIVDFVSFEKRIIVELDGGHHAGQKEKDIARDRFLEAEGFTVLRFWDNQVLGNIEEVLEVISKECLK